MILKKGTIIGLGILAVVVVLVIGVVGWGFSAYNNLVAADETVQAKASNIDADLTRRADLVPNLVNTVKGYAAHEEEVLTAVTEARARLAGSTSLEDRIEADNELTRALGQLRVVVENYPDLKASENFRMLQDQLEGTENRLKVARVDYNEAVQAYNTMLRRFPNSIIAGMFGFEKAERARGRRAAPPSVFEPVGILEKTGRLPAIWQRGFALC